MGEDRQGGRAQGSSRGLSVLRPFVVAVAAVAVATGVYIGLTLAPRHATIAAAVPPTVAFGAYHVHTTRSDGSGSVDDVAAAAAKAGLQFVILTDHGDATRTPDPPTFRHGVLCIDAVEVSTFAGHVVALGLSGAAAFPLAGEARDVIEDIHRLGGLAIIAHPDSPKPELRWREWNVDYDGVEWLNADSEWRDESRLALVGIGLRSLVRGPETVAQLFRRPVRTLQRWQMTGRHPVFALAAVDAHARLGWESDEEPRRARTLLARPSYVDMFRTLVNGIDLDAPLSTDPVQASSQILRAIGQGHAFSLVSALAGPAVVNFRAERDGQTIPMGERVDALGGLVTFKADVPGAPNARLALVGPGRIIAAGQGSLVSTGPVGPGAYHIEASWGDADVPWLLSNPIYVGPIAPSRPTVTPLPTEAGFRLPNASGWRVEHDPASSGETTTEGAETRLSFRLGPSPPAGQYVALVTDVGGETSFDHLSFTGRADRPVRVSVQMRFTGGRDGQRWRRSVYLDTNSRTVSLELSEFDPVEPTSLKPNAARILSVLFVVDTLNTSVGSDGVIWLSNITLGGR